MRFIFTDMHTGVADIERGEAINRLIDAGVRPQAATSMIETLPCGFGIEFPDENIITRIA